MQSEIYSLTLYLSCLSISYTKKLKATFGQLLSNFQRKLEQLVDSPNNVHAIQNKQEKFFSEPSVKFKSSALSGRLNTRTHHHMNHAFLQQVLARLCFSSDFCWWVRVIYTNITSSVITAAGSLCPFTQKTRMPPLPSLILPGR